MERALDYACALAGRDFTREEWQTYFPGQPYRETCSTAQLASLHG